VQLKALNSTKQRVAFQHIKMSKQL